MLSGCRANQQSIEDFIVQTQQQAQSELTALAPVLVFKVTEYQARSQRSPFTLPKAAVAMSQPQQRTDCWQPKIRDKSGQLEQFSLDKLSLKGVMSRGGHHSALVQTPSGQIVKVTAGQYVGLNNGKVGKVTASYIQVNETLPDGLGCWIRRNVKLALK
ncbi:MAG TPA: fimbrial protein [Vibrio sp.]|nr:fimbrial protein [Vibrio sp.]